MRQRGKKNREGEAPLKNDLAKPQQADSKIIEKRVSHSELAKKLFRWNASHLIHNAELKKSDIGLFFAEKFQVRANGRVYDANEDNYFEFLNQFRSTIRSIRYEFEPFIEEGARIAIPMKAQIARVGGEEELFEAILILEFDKGKIVLWQEVYARV